MNWKAFAVFWIWALPALGQSKDPLTAGTRAELAAKILDRYTPEQLNTLNDWTILGTVKLESGSADFGDHIYETVNKNASAYAADHLELTVKFLVSKTAASKTELADKIKFKLRWAGGVLSRRILSTLCPKELHLCLPSSFILAYDLENSKMTVSADRNPGLLKYDFTKKEHVGFSEKDLGALNCILGNELKSAQSFLWDFKGMKKFDEPASVQPSIDAVTGATIDANKGRAGCQIADGGLWTVLTVFAHSYETYKRIDALSIEELLKRYGMNIPDQIRLN